MATRDAGGKVIAALAESVPNLVGGSADLDPSTRTMMKGKGDFQSADVPEEGQTPPTQGMAGGVWGYAGRNIHFGIREHAMTAILTGMAHHGGVMPFGATFLTFSDYMRPSIRLAALSGAHVIYVWTHDSIALGEDGPDPPAGGAARQPAGDAEHAGAPSGRRQRDGRGVADRDAAHGRAGGAGAHAARSSRCSTGRRSPRPPAPRAARTSWSTPVTGFARAHPHRDRLGGVARARRAPAAQRRGDPEPRRVDAVVGAVRSAAGRVPRTPCCRRRCAPG